MTEVVNAKEVTDRKKCSRDNCNKSLVIFCFKCSYCQMEYCTKHRLPEDHSCATADLKQINVEKLKECLEKSSMKDTRGYINF